jgi:hypothetical protein
MHSHRVPVHHTQPHPSTGYADSHSKRSRPAPLLAVLPKLLQQGNYVVSVSGKGIRTTC